MGILTLLELINILQVFQDSDDWRFVSSTCFHCQCYCVSSCIQLVTSADIGTGCRKYFTGHTLIAHSIWLSRPLPAIEIILLARFACKTPAEKAGLIQSIQTITHTWSAGASCQSTLFKPKIVLLLYRSTRVTRRNILLNNSDDWCSISDPILLCFFVCSTCDICKMEETIRMGILSYFASL